MNSLKLKIDLTNAAQVTALAAFANSLAGNPAVARKPYETLESAEERLRKPALQTGTNETVKSVQTETNADPVPCEADRELSFSELKAKFPNTKAKSTEKFLEKLGLMPLEEHEQDQVNSENTTEATTETTTSDEKIDAHLVKSTMSELINVKDADLKQNRKKALRAKLDEYGAKNVSAVPEEKYAEFITFMRGLE